MVPHESAPGPAGRGLFVIALCLPVQVRRPAIAGVQAAMRCKVRACI